MRSHTVIYCGNRIGKDFQTGHGALIRESNEIGDHVSIGSGSIVEHHVRIGNGVRLHSHVFVPEFTILEDECWLGPNVVLTNARYPRSPRAKDELMGACIERGAKLGANVTVLPGVRIGRDALVDRRRSGGDQRRSRGRGGGGQSWAGDQQPGKLAL